MNGVPAGEAQFAGKAAVPDEPERAGGAPARRGERPPAHERGRHGRPVDGVPGSLRGRPTRSSRRSAPGESRGRGARAARSASRASSGAVALLDETSALPEGGAAWLTRLPDGRAARCASGRTRGTATSPSRSRSRRASRARSASTLRATQNQADYILIAPESLPFGCGAARRAAPGPGAAGSRGGLRGDRGRVRARTAVGRGDPQLPRLRLPVVGPAVAALRAAPGRRELRPAQLHRQLAALAAAGLVDEDELPVDRLGPAAGGGERG